MELQEVFERRFSCRNYSDEKVSDADIEKILDAALIAPSACNMQPFHIYVCKENVIAKLNELKACRLHGAPLALVVTSKNNAGWVRRQDNKEFAVVDSAIAVCHMMLKATELNLGTCWIGALNPQRVAEAVGFSSDEYCDHILVVGHKVKDLEVPTRVRQEKDKLVTFL